MATTRREARQNIGVLALMPWRDRNEWESYAKQQLSARPDWKDHWWRPNRDALEVAGEVFHQYERTGGLDARLDAEWQKLLDNIRPTHQTAGQGAGTGYKAVVSTDPRQPALFRRVAQGIGRLQETICERAIGSRYRRCGVCGQVYELQRPPREGDYACSDECREAHRQSDHSGEVCSVLLPHQMVSGLEWHKTETSTLPTAPPAPVTQRIDLPTDATDKHKEDGSPDH